MLGTIILPNGVTQKFSTGCKRIGILKSKTKGMSDIVCDYDTIFRWNGKKYE